MTDILFWSGGKDAWIALESLREEGREPVLLTTCAERDGWIQYQGVFKRHVEAQAHAMGLQLVSVALPDDASNEVYLERVKSKLEEIGASTLVFGDLHLRDIRDWREESFGAWKLEFPNWRMGPSELAYQVWNRRAVAIVTSVRDDTLDASRAGDRYTPAFAASLPDGVDAAGEGGEFHTFVVDGGWDEPIELVLAEDSWSDGFMTYAVARGR